MTEWFRALLFGRCDFCEAPLIVRRQGRAFWLECPKFETGNQVPGPPADYRHAPWLRTGEMWSGGDPSPEDGGPL